MKNSSENKHVILHVDMDHFFSAIEEREHQRFKGKPVVVGADPQEGKGRGVVKTCNYESRKFGIHSGMPISKAWQLCPNAIYVNANYPLYNEVSKRIMDILRKYSNKFQQWGSDEAFLDISSEIGDFEEATQFAVCIKHDILWNERLTCSIGVAPNKLVAKIASDFQKPDGLTVVTEDEMESFLSPLSVRKMLGIGEKTERKLNRMGIKTIGDLGSYDVSTLGKKFGVMGKRFHQWAHGIYVSEVGKRKDARKSLGHEKTFITDIEDQELIMKKMDDICRRIYERAVKYGILFKTVTVKIRFADFQTFTHGKTLSVFTNCLQELQKTARDLAEGYFRKKNQFRLIGVRVSHLKDSKGQIPLIDGN
ncbi:MAG: DNA polymerase IV [Candidatus Bathyarchaeota archaeon]|nr:MAG: DNA polymerase IV [Candidatus Bathyarchaeota archaeon]